VGGGGGEKGGGGEDGPLETRLVSIEIRFIRSTSSTTNAADLRSRGVTPAGSPVAAAAAAAPIAVTTIRGYPRVVFPSLFAYGVRTHRSQWRSGRCLTECKIVHSQGFNFRLMRF